MAGKNYASTNKDRLKNIPLGSGNVYILPYNSTYATMPTDEQFEQDGFMIGRTKNGATLSYSSEYYTAKSDDGVAQKTRLTAETVTFSWGIITWNGDTVEQILQTATVTVNGTGENIYQEIKIGGVGNQVLQEYWVHFVGGDDVDGKITVTGRGLNNAGLEAAFTNESETVLTPSFQMNPMDNDGTLVVIKMAHETTQTLGPKLSSLTIGSLVLSPTFSPTVLNYTTTTVQDSNVITATTDVVGAATQIVNGDTPVTSGSEATWEDGNNIVTITVGNQTGSTVYHVTVTKLPTD